MAFNQSANLVTVRKLYRDALRCAEMVAFQQGNPKAPLLASVRASFRQKAHLVDAQEIAAAKQAAISALGNYHAMKAYDLAMEERNERNAKQHVTQVGISGKKAHRKSASVLQDAEM